MIDLIERYLQAIGRHLPGDQRKDILRELRSALYDEVENAEANGSDEEKAVAAIKRMGPPRAVAASYYPDQQYLIGPALYPFFKLVLGIVIAAVIGAQLLVVLLSQIVPNPTISVQETLWGILQSVPAALGSVVVVFWLLQRLAVQIDWDASFDPRSLPPVSQDAEPISRGERIFNILVEVVALVLLAQFAQAGGFAWADGSSFFANPVVAAYFPWIALSMLFSIGLNIVLLWHGQWRFSTRLADLLSNGIGLILLVLLIQGHTLWLTAAGSPEFFQGLANLPQLIQQDPQTAGMVIFRMGLLVATIVVAVEILVSVIRLLRSRLDSARGIPADPVGSNP